MCAELIDNRLTAVMPEQEYRRLRARAEHAFRRIEKAAPGTVLTDLTDLVQVMREIEAKLLDDRLGERNTDWAQGSMATLA